MLSFTTTAVTCLKIGNQLTANDWDVPEQLAKPVGFYEDAAKTLEGDGQQHKQKEGGLAPKQQQKYDNPFQTYCKRTRPTSGIVLFWIMRTLKRRG
ncbi:hypothetical protein S7711_07488 [Stachybotrys chartarum IBT 7711]|uniref:Uncharacterized protein n=1 Tax=Stachybotrys chartarum (strain CBS 109288 / IBT 7711) TaxID=1280523 RepID=A0A084B7D3_STACB|nr:hypothetical protein S7711_07488 [Stachybotrys chartarum IBT 7711]